MTFFLLIDINITVMDTKTTIINVLSRQISLQQGKWKARSILLLNVLTFFLDQN